MKSGGGQETGAIDRRRALGLAAGAALSPVYPRAAHAEETKAEVTPAKAAQTEASAETLERQTAPGAGVMSPPYGNPSPFEAEVVRRDRTGGSPYPTRQAAASLTPLQDLNGIITPGGLHYERHHSGVPTIDPAEHRLIIHGLVERPKIFSVAEIMRFPATSRICFLECSGNTQNWGEPNPAYTVQDTHGLLSCSEWTGVLLKTVIEDLGVKPEARWMLAEGGDACAMTRSIPIEKVYDDAMLVYAQNGEKLRPEQGYPLRLLLPGFEGNTNVKWLRRLKFGLEPWQTREETSKYSWLMPDGTVRQFNFVMEAKSVITSPSGASGSERRDSTKYPELHGRAAAGSRAWTSASTAANHGKRPRSRSPSFRNASHGFARPGVGTGKARR